MFNKIVFQAKALRILGALLVLSSGYFIYLDSKLIYHSAKISHYEQQNPVLRFSASPTEQITYKLETQWSETQHPIGSMVTVRYPKNDYSKLEYVSPLMQWAFYIVLCVGLVIFSLGAYLTIKARKKIL